MNSEVRIQDVRCVCIVLFVPFWDYAEWKHSVVPFPYLYTNISAYLQYFPIFFFHKKIIRFTKKPFLFVKHYNITYIHTNIQNNGSSVGNSLNRYTARAYTRPKKYHTTAASLYHHQYISPEASLKSIHIYSNILYYVYKLY